MLLTSYFPCNTYSVEQVITTAIKRCTVWKTAKGIEWKEKDEKELFVQLNQNFSVSELDFFLQTDEYSRTTVCTHDTVY